MAGIVNAELLENYPVLQLSAGALAVIVGVYLTIRAAGDNKKNGHIAPAGHDPLGLTVFFNGIIGSLASMNELLRNVRDTLNSIRVEISETNSRLEQLHSSHHAEMSHLRDVVEGARPDTSQPRPRRKRSLDKIE